MPIRSFVLLALFSLALIPDASATYALEPWNMETRIGVPLPMKLWLGAILFTELASIFFVRKHIAARWVLGALIVGHAWIAIVEVAALFTLLGGMVSLGHIVCWVPAIYAFYRYRDEIQLPSAYGIWACLMLFLFCVSLIFDVRDAGIWISTLV